VATVNGADEAPQSPRAAQATAWSLGQKPMNHLAGLQGASSCWAIVSTAIRLTVTDHASRYLLSCEALASTREDLAFSLWAVVQRKPSASNIRGDNGASFASTHAVFNLSKLPVR
jgi:hypothetical protein